MATRKVERWKRGRILAGWVGGACVVENVLDFAGIAKKPWISGTKDYFLKRLCLNDSCHSLPAFVLVHTKFTTTHPSFMGKPSLYI